MVHALQWVKKGFVTTLIILINIIHANNNYYNEKSINQFFFNSVKINWDLDNGRERWVLIPKRTGKKEKQIEMLSSM